MNETDLSSLTYKELQALAVRYRVPGNIKKHQLVRVLQAVQSGNATEVEQILAELEQTRKKRMKKVKRDKINVISTPIHSPTYAMSEDYYYPQQHPPYQWVGAEEEISSREEDATRFPNYDEFQQFLLRRIQKEYRSYALPDNELAQIPSVVDLRMGAGSSIIRPMPMEVNRAKGNIIIDSNSYNPPLPGEAQSQIAKDTNGNNQVPILLKKMLQAPVGANLGQIASPDAESYQISLLEQRPNNSSDPMDDSDTLTAESDGDNDDLWDYTDAGNNNRSYYFIVNNGKEPMNINQAQLQDKTMQDIGQLPNNLMTNQYQTTGPVSDVQANCQKWIATNSFVNKDTNYAENLAENSRSYNPVYYENTSVNLRMTKSRNLEQNYQNNGPTENINCEANQSSLHGQPINEVYQYYQINNETNDAPVNPNDAYYTQHMAKRVGDLTQKYFVQGSSNNSHANMGHNDGQAAAQGAPVAQFSGNPYSRETGGLFNPLESNGLQYNMGYYPQYSNELSMAGYPNADQQQQQQYLYQQHQQQEQQEYQQHHQQQQQQQQQQYPQQSQLQQHQQQTQHRQYQQQQTNVAVVQDLADRNNVEAPVPSQPITNGALDSFWPRWPINSTVTSNGQLEPILNLHNYNCFDYTRLDQTSCVYCYTAPVVTQRVDTSSTTCTQKKRFRTECRQHSFRPNRLVYNDASTGMRMAKINEISSPKACPQESLNDGPSTSSMDLDSENMASTESSDNSINDVWIHDYKRYPSNSDYAPQNSGLIIDENENDLFSL